MKKSFETKKGPKQLCRNKLCDSVKSPSTIITLPSKEMLCVKTFKKRFPKATIIGIESDKAIFNTIIEKGQQCYHTDIRGYLEHQVKPTNHVDLFFFDYYSFLNDNVIKDLQLFIDNDNIFHENKTSILGVTLLKAIRSGEGEEILNRHKGIKKVTRSNDLTSVVRTIVLDLAIKLPRVSSIDSMYELEYKNPEGTTMYFFILKVVK